MQRNIISGMIKRPQAAVQVLHKRIGEFAAWMKRPKDAGQVRKDKLKSVPVAMLPPVF